MQRLTVSVDEPDRAPRSRAGAIGVVHAERHALRQVCGDPVADAGESGLAIAGGGTVIGARAVRGHRSALGRAVVHRGEITRWRRAAATSLRQERARLCGHLGVAFGHIGDAGIQRHVVRCSPGIAPSQPAMTQSETSQRVFICWRDARRSAKSHALKTSRPVTPSSASANRIECDFVRRPASHK
jgi:hypothetical protein